MHLFPFPRVRAATAIAAVLALFVTGVAAGAAGDFLVLGGNNDSGTSQTVLSNAGLGAAFTLKTTNVATNATGIFGWTSQTGSNATRGVYGLASGPNSYGVYGRSTGNGSGAAIFAEGNANLGIKVTTTDASGIQVNAQCDGLFCGANGVTAVGEGLGAGVSGTGAFGVQGTGVIGVVGSVQGGGTTAVLAQGDADVDGDLTVGGTCTGCTAALLASNVSGDPIEAGTAVTAVGVTTDIDGTLLVEVRPAAEGEDVLGVVDTSMHTVEVQMSAKDTGRFYRPTNGAAGKGGIVRVVTSGVAVIDGTAKVDSGEGLTVQGSAGDIVAAATDGPSFGTMLGTLDDGRLIILVGSR